MHRPTSSAGVDMHLFKKNPKEGSRELTTKFQSEREPLKCRSSWQAGSARLVEYGLSGEVKEEAEVEGG